MRPNLGQHGSIGNLYYARQNNGTLCLWVVQHTSENFVASLSAEYHLHTHSLDLAAQKIHRRARSDGCHIVSLEVVDNFRDGIQTLLDSEDIFVVHRSEIMRRFPGSDEVRRVFKTDGERVQLRPRSERGYANFSTNLKITLKYSYLLR